MTNRRSALVLSLGRGAAFVHPCTLRHLYVLHSKVWERGSDLQVPSISKHPLPTAINFLVPLSGRYIRVSALGAFESTLSDLEEPSHFSPHNGGGSKQRRVFLQSFLPN
jgi:hypothetical protein